MKYSDWLKEWLECFVRPVCKYKTYIGYAGAANRYIAPALGGCEVAQLDGVILQKFVACLVMRGDDGAGRRLSTSTVNLIITVMQSSLKCAFIVGKTATDAADNVKRPRVIERDTQCFTFREQAAIEWGHLAVRQDKFVRHSHLSLHGTAHRRTAGAEVGGYRFQAQPAVCQPHGARRTGRGRKLCFDMQFAQDGVIKEVHTAVPSNGKTAAHHKGAGRRRVCNFKKIKARARAQLSAFI